MDKVDATGIGARRMNCENEKKIGIMQPYFFPYIGYWQLIHAVDVFVVYDDGKMITNGWIHRNRILDFDSCSPHNIGVSLKKKSVNHSIGEMQRTCDIQEILQLVLGKRRKSIPVQVLRRALLG